MSKNLKNTIDKMVEDSIRRILPAVMNEILLKTIAGSGVIQESRRQSNEQVRAPVPQARPVRKSRRPASLGDLLDETAGADFYNDPRAATAEAMRMDDPPAPRGRALAQRIEGLPPELRGLAEGMELDDDDGEMSDEESIIPTEHGPPLDRAAKVVGLDFSRMKRVANVTESKKRIDADDRAANAQFEALRLKRMREQLNGGKPIE